MTDLKNKIIEFANELDVEFPRDGRTHIVEFGNKFAKVLTVYKTGFMNQTSAWGFVALSSFTFKGELLKEGDLLKASSWKSPAKHSRGNILNLTAMYGPWGPCYMDEVKSLQSFGKKLSLL